MISDLFESITRGPGPGSAGLDLLIIFALTLAASLLSRFVLARLRRSAAATDTFWDEAIYDSLGPPLRLLIWVIGAAFMAGVTVAGLGPAWLDWVHSAERVLVIVAFAWFLLRLADHAGRGYLAFRRAREESFDHAATEAATKVLKLVVIIIATLLVLQTVGISIAGILTFGGVGGIAVGFAARDMLANFFGGLMIYLDRPFKTGDWIRSPDREIEGIVEDIGWRVTVVRNFNSRPLYVPNSAFSSFAIENVSRMTHRRIYETVGIRYVDVERMDDIVSDITDYLKSHDGIDADQGLLVSFTTFAPSSLDIMIYCYTRTTVGAEFYRVKQQVMLNVSRIIEKHGAECAFPTTTVYLQGDTDDASGKPA